MLPNQSLNLSLKSLRIPLNKSRKILHNPWTLRIPKSHDIRDLIVHGAKSVSSAFSILAFRLVQASAALGCLELLGGCAFDWNGGSWWGWWVVDWGGGSMHWCNRSLLLGGERVLVFWWCGDDSLGFCCRIHLAESSGWVFVLKWNRRSLRTLIGQWRLNGTHHRSYWSYWRRRGEFCIFQWSGIGLTTLGRWLWWDINNNGISNFLFILESTLCLNWTLGLSLDISGNCIWEDWWGVGKRNRRGRDSSRTKGQLSELLGFTFPRDLSHHHLSINFGHFLVVIHLTNTASCLLCLVVILLNRVCATQSLLRSQEACSLILYRPIIIATRQWAGR